MRTLEPPVWHVDLYRIEDAAGLAELGLDSLGDGVLVVEWPERAGRRAWPDALRSVARNRSITAHAA